MFLLGRKPRFEYPGGIYHLIQRGNNKEYIFQKEEDKIYLLDLINEYKEMMDFQLLGYVIMGNHYHLIVKTSEIPLKDIMHRINSKYGRYYNKKNERTGHVFENRYKGILVIDDRYLLSLLRYVHQNPVAAHICKYVKDYPWSSDRAYRRNHIDGMVDIDLILEIFSKNRSDAIKTYIKFMDEDIKEDINSFEDTDIIGDENTKLLSNYSVEEKLSLDELLKEVSIDNTVYEEIKMGSRKRYLTSFKRTFVEMAIKANYTMREIGESISISEVAVFKIINK